MSNSLKLCPKIFSTGAKNFPEGLRPPAPPSYGPGWQLYVLQAANDLSVSLDRSFHTSGPQWLTISQGSFVI